MDPNKFTNCIPKLYKRNLESIGLFFWIEGQKKIVPAITINQSIDSFMKYNGLHIDNFNTESAMVTYYQMKKEFYESQRTVKQDSKEEINNS